jgi:cytochrome P450
VRDNELNIFETHVQQLKSAVPKNGTKFDMQQLFGSFTLDVSTNVFLGMSTNLLSLTEADRTEGQRFAKAFDYAQCTLVGAGSSSVFEFVRKLVFGDSELKDSLEVVDKFVDKILDCSLQHRLQHEASGHSIDDSFLGALMAAGRSRSDIKYDIINLLVAGKDTTAAYLSSTWYMLSKHPEVYQRLCDEISVLEDRAPTKEDLNHFPYLQMVLQEGMFEAV